MTYGLFCRYVSGQATEGVINSNVRGVRYSVSDQTLGTECLSIPPGRYRQNQHEQFNVRKVVIYRRNYGIINYDVARL